LSGKGINILEDEEQTPEDILIDQYVDLKDKQDSSDLMLELITKYLIPEGRFEEARSWRDAITNQEIKHEAAELLRNALKNVKLSSISRLPQNKDWYLASPAGHPEKTDDQQYHYDRTVSYSNASKAIIQYLDDVKICRNEWITFVTKGAYKSLKEYGAEIDTIAMGISDYIEFILIPDQFYFFTEGDSTPTIGSGIEETTSPEAQPVKLNPVRNAYGNQPEMVDYFQTHFPQLLDDGFVQNFFVSTAVVGGKDEEILVTQNYLAFIPGKKSGWGAGDLNVIDRSTVDHISVGSEVHTEYQGLISKTQSFWTLTFATNQYTQFTRWMYLGKNESEMNVNRPKLGKTLDVLSGNFELVQGDSFQTSGGYTTSVGFGFWV